MKRAVSALLVLLLLLAPVPGIAAAAGDDPSEVPEETVVAQAESDEGQGPEETQNSQPQDAQAEGEAEPPAQPSEPDGDGRDEGPGAADGSRENKDASPYLQAVITASRDTYAPRDTASFSIRYALEPGVASPGDYVVALIPETVAHRTSLSCSFQHFAEMKSLGQGRFLLILGEQAAACISGTMTLYVEIDAQEAVADTITVGKAAITIAVAPAMEDSVGTDGHSGTEAAAAQEATESGTGVDGGADENGPHPVMRRRRMTAGLPRLRPARRASPAMMTRAALKDLPQKPRTAKPQAWTTTPNRCLRKAPNPHRPTLKAKAPTRQSTFMRW